jgi:hypothetical protein
MDNIALTELRNSDGGSETARKRRKVNKEKRGTGAKRVPEWFYYLTENKRITLF